MPRIYNRKKVVKLPEDAKTVQEYAKSIGRHHSYVYRHLRKGTADFRIIEFQGINFVIKK